MKKKQLFIITLLAIVFIFCYTGSKIFGQKTEIGKLILNQDQIETIGIVEGPTDENTVKLSDSTNISTLISMIDKIPVKKLTIEEDNNFMQKRMREVHLCIGFYDYNNPSVSLQGQLFIWPDGYIYAVDVISMNSNQRTISYLSESKYPEIYEWVKDELK